MTIDEFITEFSKIAKNHQWLLDDCIRTTTGLCPMMAYRANLKNFGDTGLSGSDICKIIASADNNQNEYFDLSLRTKFLEICFDKSVDCSKV